MFKNYFISAAVIAVVFSVDFQQRCLQLNNSFYHGSSCFIGQNNPIPYASAKTSCTHMGIGHLAFIGSKQTMEKLAALTDIISPTNNIAWIGLEQKDPAPEDEPAGKWSWMHPDGRFWMPSTHLFMGWLANLPSDDNNAKDGCLNGSPHNGVADCWNIGQSTDYICEYENSAKKYKKHAENTIGNNMTKMQETVESHIGNCAIQCSKELPCRAYSYNDNNGSCVLHYLPSNGFASFEPEDQQGYTMFDTYY